VVVLGSVAFCMPDGAECGASGDGVPSVGADLRLDPLIEDAHEAVQSLDDASLRIDWR